MSQETMQPDLAVHNVLLSVLRLKVKAHLKVMLNDDNDVKCLEEGQNST